jgi:DMSO/TMAO reductase YedYZ heme-binding membrane subunit
VTSRGRSRIGPRVTSVAGVTPDRRGRIIVICAVFLAGVLATGASGETTLGRTVLDAVQRFMLFYAGVFALIALTASVGIGLVATDRIVMGPGSRVVAQAMHRAVSLAALGFLVVHIATEILAQRVTVIDAFIPFLARGRTFYIGLGTVASDLLVVLIVTGLARSRFAGTRPGMWRAIHASAYGCWFIGLLHGLLAGREGKPYVNWSYGACVAAVLLALTIRTVATMRDGRETAPQAVPSRPASPVPAAMSAMAPLAMTGRNAAVPDATPARRALPAAGQYAQDYSGQPYSGTAYQGSGSYPGTDSYPGTASYSGYPGAASYPGTGYDGQPYPGGSYARRPYADEAYSGDAYDDEMYGQFSATPAPQLWPDHPSAPMQQITGLTGDPWTYPPPGTDGR